MGKEDNNSALEKVMQFLRNSFILNWYQSFLVPVCYFILFPNICLAQQVQWVNVYPLPKQDKINCIVKDSNHLYAGGYTYRNAILNDYYKAMLIKLNINGDTVFVKDLGFTGHVTCMAIDPLGNLKLIVKATSWITFDYQISISMTSEGFIFRRDTLRGIPLACTVGNDSSLIVVGYRGRTGFPGQTSMYFQRIHFNGVIDPFIELNPGHPDCRANRIEQLPNGHYLISGYVGSRVASYEVDSVGGNPVFHQWYQSANTTNMSSGHVGRLGQKNWMIAGSGAPDMIAAYDSSQNKIWMRHEQGVQQPPQAMRDTSIVFGYSLAVWPLQYFARLRLDSSQVWFFNMRDSLNARGILGSLNINSYAYFDDESAIFAGEISQDDGIPPDTDNDPFFLRIANVGTPVTSLTKPKRGTLSNETLAPWPNPSGGTLYLKQHFDKAEVHFYTVSGQEVQTDTVRFGQPINISSFAPGLYLYRAVIDGKPFSGKVVRN